MRIPWLGKLVGLVRPPKPVNLDAAMLRIASVIEPNDSFCVTENLWRHGAKLHLPQFQVSLFNKEECLIQHQGVDLDKVVEVSLDEYRGLVK